MSGSGDMFGLGDFSMLDLFRSEVEAQANVFNDGLIELERDPANAATAQRETLESIMRAAHSLKGAARIVDLDPVVQVAHLMEDGLVAALDGKIKLNNAHIDACLRAVDFIGQLSKETEDSLPMWLVNHAAEHAQLEEDLKAAAEGKLEAKPAGAKSAEPSAAAERKVEVEAAPVEAVVETVPPAPPSAPSAPAPNPLAGFADLGLFDLFKSELEIHGATLNEGLSSLDLDAPHATLVEPLAALMRAAHSLKGASRVIGLDAATHIAHAMEDLMVAAQEQRVRLTGTHIDTLLRGVDWLMGMLTLSEAQVGDWLAAKEADRASIEQALHKILSSPAAPAPPPMAPAEDPGYAPIEPAASPTPSIPPVQTAVAAPPKITSAAPPKVTPGGPPRVTGSLPLAPGSVVPQKENPGVAPASPSAVTDAPATPAAPPKITSRGIPRLGPTRPRSEAARLRAGGDGLVPVVGTAPAPWTAVKPGPGTPGPAGNAAPPAAADRAVKVTAESLSRLMGLAAESLVEAHKLQPLSAGLLDLKHEHFRLSETWQRLRTKLGALNLTTIGAADLCHEADRVLDECRRLLSLRIADVESFAGRSANLSDRLYREVRSSRMRPFSDGVSGFPRMVRDIARQLGKKVKFEIAGQGTQVDRDVLEKLEAPIGHILRNALDHGMELPEARTAAGKPAEGTVKLEAHHHAGMLLITVSEDGRGISLPKLRERVVEKGLSTLEMISGMGDDEVLEFLFLPGFSTAQKVTEVSGRGVGLDVVQTMVHAAGGEVRIDTTEGRGTSFQLYLPITQSVLRALLVTIAGEPYAFPLAQIVRTALIAPSELRSAQGRQYIALEGIGDVGVVAAEQVFGLGSQRPETDLVPIVVVSDQQHYYGVEVDAFLGEKELVVRPLDPRLGKVPEIMSVSLMDDGVPVLVVDIDDTVRSIDAMLSDGSLRRAGRRRRRRDNVPAEGARRKRVLVVDDSVTVREVERKLLENQGYEVEVAVDGMEGWNAVRLGQYDLVVSDVDMPRMNGIELVRMIKADPRLQSMPVMIVSYKDRAEDRIRGMQAGANYYLTKGSFHDATLVRAVLDLIGPAQEGAPAEAKT